MVRIFPLLFLSGLFLGSFSSAEALSKIPNDRRINYFNSGAQFRGGIKKYFADVGLGFTFSRKKKGGVTQSAFFVLAQHPQKKKEKYLIDMAMEFTKKGSEFKIRKMLRKTIKGFRKSEQKEIPPFLCILSYAIGADFPRERQNLIWSVGDIEYDVKIVAKRIKRVPGFEISLKRKNGAMEVKMFLMENHKGHGNKLWKFRLKSGKISTTFETATYEEISQKHKGKNWFSKYF